jgi:hypothetical protein
MNPELQQTLLALDEPGLNWCPRDPGSSFSWELVESLHADLSRLAGRTLDIDEHVQYASFITDIGWLDEEWWDRSQDQGARVYELAFRFSQFGFLVAVQMDRRAGSAALYFAIITTLPPSVAQ